MKFISNILKSVCFGLSLLLGTLPTLASEANLRVPDIKANSEFSFTLLLIGIGVSVIGVIFGYFMYSQVKKLEVHEVMSNVGNTIFET